LGFRLRLPLRIREARPPPALAKGLNIRGNGYSSNILLL
jgi:hypothetical protein